MARRRIPVITPQDINAVQLSPALRKLLGKRARAFATKKFKSEFAGLMAERGAIKQAFRQEKRAARGSTRYLASELGDQIQGLKAAGLKGDYLQQAISELKHRQTDALSATPFLVADARQSRDEALLENRSSIIDTKVAQKQTAVDALQSAVNKAYTAGASEIAERQEARQDRREGDPEAKRALKNALITARTLWTQLQENAGTRTEDGMVIKPPSTNQEWREFALTVAEGSDGADQADALKAIKILRKKIAAEQRRASKQIGQGVGSLLGQLGNYVPGG